MRSWFDIITNHTADVIGFEGSQTKPYVSKDAVPYKTAAGTPFDDRDYAGDPGFPALDAATSFPYKPVVPTAELFLDSPAQYYFAFDGHLNPKGSKRVADFLISGDQNKTN